MRNTFSLEDTLPTNIANSIFDLKSGEIIYPLDATNAVNGQFSKDGSKLVTLDRKGVRVYSTADWSYLWGYDIVDENEHSFNFSLVLNEDASKIVATKNADSSAEYLGQAYFFEYEGISENNTTDKDDFISVPSVSDDVLVRAISDNMDVTLSGNSLAEVDVDITNEFTIDCAGYDLILKGRILINDTPNKQLTIINPGKIDLSGLEFYKNPNMSVAGDTDYIVFIKGENIDIVYPSDIGPGSHKEQTKGFFYEEKSSSVAIRYGG